MRTPGGRAVHVFGSGSVSFLNPNPNPKRTTPTPTLIIPINSPGLLWFVDTALTPNPKYQEAGTNRYPPQFWTCFLKVRLRLIKRNRFSNSWNRHKDRPSRGKQQGYTIKGWELGSSVSFIHCFLCCAFKVSSYFLSFSWFSSVTWCPQHSPSSCDRHH